MSTLYEITVVGSAGPTLSAALQGFQLVTSERGRARFVGAVEDQAALQGALHRLYDLQVELLEVRRIGD